MSAKSLLKGLRRKLSGYKASKPLNKDESIQCLLSQYSKQPNNGEAFLTAFLALNRDYQLKILNIQSVESLEKLSTDLNNYVENDDLRARLQDEIIAILRAMVTTDPSTLLLLANQYVRNHHGDLSRVFDSAPMGRGGGSSYTIRQSGPGFVLEIEPVHTSLDESFNKSQLVPLSDEQVKQIGWQQRISVNRGQLHLDLKDNWESAQAAQENPTHRL